MKNFEYAKIKAETKEKTFKMPTIKTNTYNIPLWALPIALFVIVYDKFNEWNYNRLIWDEKKATKVLDYFLPYALEYNKENQAYYYCMNWGYYGLSVAKKVPIGLKAWSKKFSYEILWL